MRFENKYPMDEKMRVLICPQCENEEISDNAAYCRICGEKLYNHCSGGEWNDWLKEYEPHNNYGNARFCETCGKPTYFSTQGYLDSLESVKPAKKQLPKAVGNVVNLAEYAEEDDDLPF